MHICIGNYYSVKIDGLLQFVYHSVKIRNFPHSLYMAQNGLGSKFWLILSLSLNLWHTNCKNHLYGRRNTLLNPYCLDDKYLIKTELSQACT